MSRTNARLNQKLFLTTGPTTGASSVSLPSPRVRSHVQGDGLRRRGSDASRSLDLQAVELPLLADQLEFARHWDARRRAHRARSPPRRPLHATVDRHEEHVPDPREEVTLLPALRDELAIDRKAGNESASYGIRSVQHGSSAASGPSPRTPRMRDRKFCAPKATPEARQLRSSWPNLTVRLTQVPLLPRLVRSSNRRTTARGASPRSRPQDSLT